MHLCPNEAIHSLVIVHDGVKPMSDREHRAIGEFSTNCLLNEVICFHVNGSSGFIQDQDFGFA